MKEPLTLFASRTAGAVGLVGSMLLICDCTSSTQQLGFVEDPAPPVLTDPDAGSTDDAAPQDGLISYCPSNKCPPGWMTCPDSRFPCDTNILDDSRNCGECGIVCPPGAGADLFTCNDGACALRCYNNSKDCDGLVDNGCESFWDDRTNCGACGVVCAVGERCTWQDDELTELGCGCPLNELDCGFCTDVRSDDDNCGACNNPCDPTGGPNAPQYSNMYYGCGSSECGVLKCEPNFGNCDGDVKNGCETSTVTDDNCGVCGKQCAAGQKCAVDTDMIHLSCMCDPGLTFCQTGEVDGLPVGYCADVSSSTSDCGVCGVSCAVYGGGYRQRAVCDFGKCVVRCTDGAADCNGSQFDGCEIDTKSDPRNCGGCGITCDLTLGQACVAGRCVVEPCDEADAGEVPR